MVLMTVEEFVKAWESEEKPDIDVYDDVVEELGIAYCSGSCLTEEGKEHFKEVLTYTMEVFEDQYYALVKVDDEEGIWQEKLKKAEEFFYSAAGYCASSDFDKWFKEV